MPRLMLSPAAKTNLMIYGLVPFGLAIAGAGLAALEELFGERTAVLREMEDQIAALRAELRAAELGDVLDAELVDEFAGQHTAAPGEAPSWKCPVHGLRWGVSNCAYPCDQGVDLDALRAVEAAPAS